MATSATRPGRLIVFGLMDATLSMLLVETHAVHIGLKPFEDGQLHPFPFLGCESPSGQLSESLFDCQPPVMP